MIFCKKILEQLEILKGPNSASQSLKSQIQNRVVNEAVITSVCLSYLTIFAILGLSFDFKNGERPCQAVASSSLNT